MVTLTQGNVRVELESIGEGLGGDYDPDDPGDVELLRFTVLRREDGEWEQIDDASYCTLLPESLDREKQGKAVDLIMEEVYYAASKGYRIAGTCEQLSWIDESWIDDNKVVVHGYWK